MELHYNPKLKPAQQVFREWGKIKYWSFETHFTFPKEFKKIVKTMLLVKYRPGNELFEIPHSVVWIIFEFLSRHYIPVNALDKIEWPGKKIEPGENNNENDDYY